MIYPAPREEDIVTLAQAALQGDVEEIKAYIEKFGKAAVNLKRDKGCSAISSAPQSHTSTVNWAAKEEALVILIESGADLELPNRHGMTALSIAARNGLEGMTRILLEAGAILPPGLRSNHPHINNLLEDYTEEARQKRQAQLEKMHRDGFPVVQDIRRIQSPTFKGIKR